MQIQKQSTQKGKNLLIVAFSILKQYPREQLEALSINQKKVFICSPYDWVHNSWNPLRLLKRLLKPRIHQSKKHNHSNDSISNPTINTSQEKLNQWATALSLKEYITEKFNLNVSVIEPSNFYYLTLPLALIWASTKQDAIRSNLLGRRTNIYIAGIESTGYLLDSLMRYNNKFRIQDEASLKNIITATIVLAKFQVYYTWLNKYTAKQTIDEVLINHNVYLESGYLATFMYEKHQAKILHYKHILLNITQLTNPRDRWLNQVISPMISVDNESNYKHKQNQKLEFQKESVNTSSTSKQLPWFNSQSIANLETNQPLKVNCRKYLIVMHAFTDANNIHDEDALFLSYYHWVKETLKIANHNPNFYYIFRFHPSTFKYYKKDIGIAKTLFSNKADNVVIENPEESNSFNPEEELPIVVTYQGSIALECALIGYKAITVGTPTSPADSYIQAKTMREYVGLLSTEQNPEQFFMDEDQIREAQIWKHNLLQAMTK